MRVVLDASVVLKWLLSDPEQEPDTERATALLQAVAAGRVDALQPVHWLVEVAAVLSRLSPATAADDVMALQAMELPTSEDLGVLRRACTLAVDTGQHLFDTLYHAVALESEETLLVTADERYLRAAGAAGCILPLREWTAA